ncbi:unnamed protein product [Sphagnum jensenii]|uniref:Uncharacterized protein n=1 Tax=Sphagnum jensenii TaxID=128206 RepID=A0ABP1C275_9BRYO
MGAQGASCTFHDNTIFARCEILHLHLIKVPSTTFTATQQNWGAWLMRVVAGYQWSCSKTSIASRVLVLLLLSYCHLEWLLQNQRFFHCYKSSCCIYKGIRVTAI